MSDYRIYYVVTARPKPGKIEAAGRWWVERGIKLFESMPGTKSVRAYIAQFNLSGEAFKLEIWQELESYAAFDQWDEHSRSAAPDIYIAFLTEFHQHYDIGPCRVMGQWPTSRPEVGVA
jgi:hypothetical protein